MKNRLLLSIALLGSFVGVQAAVQADAHPMAQVAEHCNADQNHNSGFGKLKCWSHGRSLKGMFNKLTPDQKNAVEVRTKRLAGRMQNIPVREYAMNIVKVVKNQQGVIEAFLSKHGKSIYQYYNDLKDKLGAPASDSQEATPKQKQALDKSAVSTAKAVVSVAASVPASAK